MLVQHGEIPCDMICLLMKSLGLSRLYHLSAYGSINTNRQIKKIKSCLSLTYQVQEWEGECHSCWVCVPLVVIVPIIFGPDGKQSSDYGPQQKPDRKSNSEKQTRPNVFFNDLGTFEYGKHLNNKILLVCYSDSGNNLFFKPSVTQHIIQTTYDLNNKLLGSCSSHDLNNELFDGQTILDHLNTELFTSLPSCLNERTCLSLHQQMNCEII